MAPSKKTMIFVCLLVAAVAVCVPVAQGQSMIPIISGTLYCSANLGLNATNSGVVVSPPLSNVTVQLICGAGNGTLVASVQTNSQGVFTIVLNPLSTLPQLLNGCRLVVATPIVGCNATLPSTAGILTSSLTLVGGLLSSILSGIFNFVPSGFI